MSVVKCCLCGKSIESWGSKNPHPMGKESQRCCDECFTKIVIPARQVLVGEKEEGEKQITVSLSEEFELWKLERIRDSFNPEYTLEEMAQTILSDAIIERERAL